MSSQVPSIMIVTQKLAEVNMSGFGRMVAPPPPPPPKKKKKINITKNNNDVLPWSHHGFYKYGMIRQL